MKVCDKVGSLVIRNQMLGIYKICANDYLLCWKFAYPLVISVCLYGLLGGRAHILRVYVPVEFGCLSMQCPSLIYTDVDCISLHNQTIPLIYSQYSGQQPHSKFNHVSNYGPLLPRDLRAVIRLHV